MLSVTYSLGENCRKRGLPCDKWDSLLRSSTVVQLLASISQVLARYQPSLSQVLVDSGREGSTQLESSYFSVQPVWIHLLCVCIVSSGRIYSGHGVGLANHHHTDGVRMNIHW